VTPFVAARAARVAARLLLSMALLAASLGVEHLTAPRAAAIFICGHTYCGALNISSSGPGSGNAASDPAGVDCTWSGGTQTSSGTCSYLFGWDDSPSTYVDVTITPTASSIACVDGPCAGAGQAVGTSAVLNNQSVTTLSVYYLKATALTISLHPTGDGSGRITSSPSGLDCRDVAGTTSGTCSHTWYANGSVTITLTYTPDPGSAYCRATCDPVGAPHSFTENTSGTTSIDVTDGFKLGHPIVTVAVQGQGKVTSTPAGISCPSTCSSYFAPATSLNLKATPSSGSVFTGWSGACSPAGTVSTCILALGSSDVSATAVFAKIVTPPPPTPTPRPTATPRPGTTSGPTPIPTTAASAGPSGAVPSVAASESAPTDPAPPLSSGSASPDPASTVSGSIGPGAGPGGGTAAASGPDLGGVGLGVLVGLVLALILVLGLGAGFLAGRRRRGPLP
jgi:List-Bact-rpt repeat protein